MPNHITNRLTISAIKEDLLIIKDGLKSEDSLFDFNTIVPMPKELNITSSSLGDMGLFILHGIQERKYFSDHEELKRFWEYSDDYKIQALKLGARYKKNIDKYGFKTWYSWAYENWGTKWNAYSVSEWNENSITFETAWSGVPNLICELSKKYPLVQFVYIYASEDSGCNVGDIIIQDGEIIQDKSPSNETNKAYEIYLELHPDCEYVKLIDGKYQYIDDEE